MPELTIAEQLLYSTVKLTTAKSGAVSGSGTGFFMNFDLGNGRSAPVIVTNKHVLHGNDQVTAICHFGDGQQPSGKFVACNINIQPGGIINHPDESVDLCAVPFADILVQAENAGTPIFLKFLAIDLIPADDDWQYFDALEDVTMIGCPNGISDEVNNLPIIRRGITATSLGKDYNGKKEFMVDMACFPGSSGSPIFIYNRDGFLDRKNNSYMMGQARIKLVGILHAGPQITNTGQIVLAQPPRVAVASMMHLGYAINSSRLFGIQAEVKRLFSTVPPQQANIDNIDPA